MRVPVIERLSDGLARGVKELLPLAQSLSISGADADLTVLRGRSEVAFYRARAATQQDT